ncbi:flagellar biosynthesis protein FlhF [Cytobacillus purgationiresistens]|uniref:Flagellar biosynthesis protein FlhF n=1 Tax=Cytobacillus purgationiresistens TaxID=863449 RepID=A0ABU0AG24_9BACI|nr:flagellar biosynthesis protein FlhF [Cytobacillus purgationiresistens]MDQ0270211.1 flagellar biosynthesis protein FlhF [Cytobacillus purgationiresistens]
MKVKKFIASSMPEAMKQIRAELGNDAVILNTRNIKTGGFLGLFQKESLEVLAAIDPVHSAEKKMQQQINRQLTTDNHITATQTLHASTSNDATLLLEEITNLKKLVSGLNPNGQTPSAETPAPIHHALELLIRQEFDDEYIQIMKVSLLEKWYMSGSDATNEEVFQWLRALLKDQIKDIPFGGVSFSKKYVNVVGPTGVGKTTTLAKMAAESVIKHQKRVAFITTDTYRIAAIDQLKTYAKILDVPLEVCYSSEDFKQAIAAFSHYDAVFIDTAGRNFRNEQYVIELNEMLGMSDELETFLVLALTAKQTDMKDICNQFSAMDIDRFIFTKIDETSSTGSLYNLVLSNKKGIAYITNGQDVPDDLIVGSAEELLNVVMEGK